MTPKDVLFISYIGAFLAFVSVLFLAFVAYAAYQGVDRLHEAIEDRGRPQPASAHDDAVAIELAEACCERWWTSAGAEHSPECPNHRRSSAT